MSFILATLVLYKVEIFDLNLLERPYKCIYVDFFAGASFFFSLLRC